MALLQNDPERGGPLEGAAANESSVDDTEVCLVNGSLYPKLTNDTGAAEVLEITEGQPLQEKCTISEDPRSDSGVASPVIAGPVPPDGGLRAWVVMLASFICNGIIFGTINTSGILFKELKEILIKDKVQNPASAATLPFSLAIGTTFFLSMLAGVFTDKLGIRVTTMFGGFLATLGLLLSSIFYSDATVLTFTFGLIFGIGASLAYTPSLVILGHYFQKRMGVVNGFVTAGSSIFTIALTFILPEIISRYNLKVVFQVLTGLMAALMMCGFVFKPLLPDINIGRHINVQPGDVSIRSKCRKCFGQFINFEIWKNKKYVIWTVAIPSALFGYFVPYVHIVEFASNILNDDSKAEKLVLCIGITSMIGRLVFGFIADRPSVNRILLQQISFFCIGTFTMCLIAAKDFWVFVVLTLGMGLFDGCFISLLGPIAFDIVGSDGASQAIGCLLGMCSIPLTLGPYIAGVMEDHLDSYTIPFLCAGIPPIVGCFALCLLRFVKEPEKKVVGVPLKENEEKQNNAQSLPASAEAQALISNDSSVKPKKDSEELVQVDVRRLPYLQRESSL